MKYADFLCKDMHLVLLRLLAEMPGYRANSSVLAQLLTQFGHMASRNEVKSGLRWLAERGLVSLDEAESVLVATLQEAGQDVAEGRAVVDGIARPRA